MPQWFLAKYRYNEPINDSTVGTRSQEFVKTKTINESILLDAVSYTEAESRTYQEIAANITDFEITGLGPMKLADVFFNEAGGEVWYKVKAVFITDDEKTGKQKKTPSVMLVNAQNPKQAYEYVENALKTALDPFEITDVNTTNIQDVYPYVEENATLVDKETGEELTSTDEPKKTLSPSIPVRRLTKAQKILKKMAEGLAQDGVTVSVKGPGDGEYRQIT